ncbi:hypothetical protein ACN93_21210 [Gordonia paraffinivorans]|nr:hypothetical protein ACN93_21210 [Gordonia paraffinivorans]
MRRRAWCERNWGGFRAGVRWGLPKLADSLKEVLQQRKSIAEDVERMLDDHPLSQVLMSMPGVGVRTAARTTTTGPSLLPLSPCMHRFMDWADVATL